jgi:hypothetical protein
VLAHYGGIYLDLDDVRDFIKPSKSLLLTDTGLPTPSRPPSFLPSMGAPNEADWNLKRRNGLCSSTSFLLEGHGVSPSIR